MGMSILVAAAGGGGGGGGGAMVLVLPRPRRPMVPRLVMDSRFCAGGDRKLADSTTPSMASIV